MFVSADRGRGRETSEAARKQQTGGAEMSVETTRASRGLGTSEYLLATNIRSYDSY